MADMARFIKPILSVVPPDPGAFNPFDWMPVVGLAKTFRDLPERLQSTFVQLMTMSATEFLAAVVRDRPADRDDVGVRDHRDVPGGPVARDRVRAAPPLHGRDRRRVPRVGDPAGRHRRDLGVDRVGGPSGGRRDPHRGAGGADRRSGRPRQGRRPRVRRGDRAPAPCSRAWTRTSRSSASSSPRTSTRRSCEEVKRYKFRGSSGKVNLALDGAARARVQARQGRVAPRRDQLLAGRRLHGARVRRREVRPVLEPPLHRLHHPHARRSVDGAARQARDVVLRAVRAVPPLGRADVGRRRARRVRRDRDLDARGAVPEHPQPDPAPTGAHAARHRARSPA